MPVSARKRGRPVSIWIMRLETVHWPFQAIHLEDSSNDDPPPQRRRVAAVQASQPSQRRPPATQAQSSNRRSELPSEHGDLDDDDSDREPRQDQGSHPLLDWIVILERALCADLQLASTGEVNKDRLVKKLVRLALACEFTRQPIRRPEISAKGQLSFSTLR